MIWIYDTDTILHDLNIRYWYDITWFEYTILLRYYTIWIYDTDTILYDLNIRYCYDIIWFVSVKCINRYEWYSIFKTAGYVLAHIKVAWPFLSYNKKFTSTVTKQIQNLKNNLNCKSQDVIYLLTCSNCNARYVWRKSITTKKWICIHRTSTVAFNILLFTIKCI